MEICFNLYILKVLIGLISKNRAAILPRAIQSALEQSINEKFISIFDDHSTDDTKKLKERFPQVEWYFSETDKGYVYGRNKLMRETTAEYYCSLDDDSWFIKKDSLSIACNYLDEHRDVAAIAFDILSSDRPDIEKIIEPVETNLFVGCGHVLRLSAVREVGYYIPFPGFYAGEERDLCIRLIDKGYKIVKFPGVHVWHDKSMVSRNLKLQCMSNACNDLSYAYVRFPLGIMLISIPYKAVLQIKHGVKSHLLWPAVKGVFLFVFSLFALRLKRNAVSRTAFKKFRSLH